MILIKPSHTILTDIDGQAILERIEAAGRTCYKSEPKDAKAFVAKIIKMGHHSVIEHESISVRFICDRGVTHELVRHRLAAFSQESTRYCNYAGGVTFVIPPWVTIASGTYDSSSLSDDAGIGWTPADWLWYRSMGGAEVGYQRLLTQDWSPQQARTILPNSLKTEIIMTANLREWRHVLKLRTSKAAHPQMVELMVPLLAEFKQRIPVVFDDIGA